MQKVSRIVCSCYSFIVSARYSPQMQPHFSTLFTIEPKYTGLSNKRRTPTKVTTQFSVSVPTNPFDRILVVRDPIVVPLERRKVRGFLWPYVTIGTDNWRILVWADNREAAAEQAASVISSRSAPIYSGLCSPEDKSHSDGFMLVHYPRGKKNKPIAPSASLSSSSLDVLAIIHRCKPFSIEAWPSDDGSSPPDIVSLIRGEDSECESDVFT